MTQLSTLPAEQTAVLQAAQRLSEAAARHLPCAPVRDLIGTTNVGLAYAVQERLTAERAAAGARIVGRKIGLTSAAVQQQLGVDQPDFGVLFDDMAVRGTIQTHRLLQPKVEAEIAFVLAEDLEHGPLDLSQVRGAVDYAVAALEIVDSRIAGWDISFADTVADNASSGLFVLGERRVSLAAVEPKDTAMELVVDGRVASTGSGDACLGDPLRALAWLAGTARDLGEPLRAGQVILSGALGPMLPVVSGSEVSARITGLGEVTVRFSTKEEA